MYVFVWASGLSCWIRHVYLTSSPVRSLGEDKQTISIITLRREQNGRHFADDIFKCISLNENERISNKISLKFVLKGSINNIPALVQIMAWRRPGDKPLSEPMMVSLPTHICVTRPQWVRITHMKSYNAYVALYKWNIGIHWVWSQPCVLCNGGFFKLSWISDIKDLYRITFYFSRIRKLLRKKNKSPQGWDINIRINP